MDTSAHDLETLFLQLGLPNAAEDIQAFIDQHRNKLPPAVALPDADFWTPAQAAFLRDAIQEDSDWCEVVDELDSRLRRN